MHNERLLRLPEVRKRVPYSRATIYRKMELKEFPLQISLGGRAVAWRETEIDRWIADRIRNARPEAA